MGAVGVAPACKRVPVSAVSSKSPSVRTSRFSIVAHGDRSSGALVLSSLCALGESAGCAETEASKTWVPSGSVFGSGVAGSGVRGKGLRVACSGDRAAGVAAGRDGEFDRGTESEVVGSAGSP